MYVYVSEQEKFNDFANGDALIWLEEELVYGDWTSGVNGDGSYEKKTNLAISEVCYHNFLLSGDISLFSGATDIPFWGF